MNLSMRWLSDFVDIDAKPHDFCEAITLSGSKVEGYTVEGSEISNVIVGKILSIEKHPDADKLVVCQVDVGSGEPIQIVTGATNLTVGDVVPVAMDNSTLPGGKKIRCGALSPTVCFALWENWALPSTTFPTPSKTALWSLMKM